MKSGVLGQATALRTPSCTGTSGLDWETYAAKREFLIDRTERMEREQHTGHCCPGRWNLRRRNKKTLAIATTGELKTGTQTRKPEEKRNFTDSPGADLERLQNREGNILLQKYQATVK
jgi:hypothetical protein